MILAALRSAALAQTLVPTIGQRLAGTREDAQRFDTAVTPPDYAFAIWGPIFAACLADAWWPGQAATPERGGTGWPLAGAYALNTAWSVATQTDNWQATPVLLPAAAGLAGLAYRRVQDVPAATGTRTATAAGLLLGWTALASAINVAGVAKASPAVATAGAAGVAAAVCATIARSRRGHLALGAATTWGLATNALDAARPPLVRLATGTAAAAVLTTTALRERVRRRR